MTRIGWGVSALSVAALVARAGLVTSLLVLAVGLAIVGAGYIIRHFAKAERPASD